MKDTGLPYGLRNVMTGAMNSSVIASARRMLRPAAMLALLVVAATEGFAQTSAHGSLRVVGQVEGSMSIEFTVGSTTHNVAVGSRSASFTVPVFRGSFSQGSSPIAAGDTTFLISSPFGIKVLKANLASSSYTLKAGLSLADKTDVWKIDGVGISSGAEQIIASSELYATNRPHVLVVSGNASVAPRSLGRDLQFTVIAN